MSEAPASFRRGKLGDVITLIRGFDLPEQARVPGDVPIVTSSGITGTHNEAKVPGPGVVTGRYGTPLIGGPEDELTRQIFGDYISIYDFQRSVEIGSTLLR